MKPKASSDLFGSSSRISHQIRECLLGNRSILVLEDLIEDEYFSPEEGPDESSDNLFCCEETHLFYEHIIRRIIFPVIPLKPLESPFEKGVLDKFMDNLIPNLNPSYEIKFLKIDNHVSLYWKMRYGFLIFNEHIGSREQIRYTKDKLFNPSNFIPLEIQKLSICENKIRNNLYNARTKNQGILKNLPDSK